MKHLIPVAILLALTACGEKEPTVVLPEQSSGAQQGISPTANDSASSDSAQTSESFVSSGSSGASGSSGSGTMYTVKEGETLAGIANKHNVRYQDLARWNNIDNPDLIHPSQQLRLSEP